MNGLKRKSFEYINNITSKKLIGVEVGVYLGDNALNILENMNINKLFLVDPYIVYPEYNVIDLPTSLEEAKQRAKEAIKDYECVSWIYKKFSECFITDFDDRCIDFIYIDGEHSYESFKSDLRCACLLVNKNKGFLCGHDADFNSVRTALEEFVLEHHLHGVYYDNAEGAGMDWLIEV
jgi:hypothetical protein